MFSEKLLAWYDKAQRTLPWRTDSKNPYYTWLSEIMLQQTTVNTVIPYFQSFIEKWPTIQDLAAASLDEVLTQWQGLGYYSRARNLHKCAQSLAKQFPTTEEELLTLTGIGPYTAAAIASIAFEKKAAAVDGNVVRVLSRYFTIEKPNPVKEVKYQLKSLLPLRRYGDFTQALMELGALVCKPTRPLCFTCPLQEDCKAHILKKTENFPVKIPKQKLPTRYATAFVLRRKDGAILLRKRPPKGLLGGMMEVPTTPWIEQPVPRKKKGIVIRHTFTHFHFKVEVLSLPFHTIKTLPEGLLKEKKLERIWVHPHDLQNYAIPTVMKKILKVGLIAFSQDKSFSDDGG